MKSKWFVSGDAVSGEMRRWDGERTLNNAAAEALDVNMQGQKAIAKSV